MAKGIITSFNVRAASNGYTLCYTIKTKTPPAAGQTYANTDYKDVDKVFKEGDEASLLTEIKSLLGFIEDGADEEMKDAPVLTKEDKY